MSEVKGRTDKAIEFLRQWSKEGPWVLTAIQPDRKAIATKTFRIADLKEMERWIEEYNGVRNLYFHVNSTMREISKKAEREDIKSMDWLHIDVDPRAGEDINTERERALRMLQHPPVGVPTPTVIIFSGGGYQGFWKLVEPVPINGDLSRSEDAKRYNQQLEILYGADNCHNIDRIMRLPGTLNIPDAKKLKKGRKIELAELVEFDHERVYELSRFTPAPEVQLRTDMDGIGGYANDKSLKISGNIPRLDSVHDLDEWGVPDRVKVLIVQGRVPDEGPKPDDDSRSSWLFDCICQLARAGVPDEVIYSVITDEDNGIAESVIDKGTNADKYARRQIARAKQEVVEPWLRKLNDKHAVIGNMAGKCRVIEDVYDAALKRTKITRQSFDDFRNRYMHIGVVVAQDPQKGPSMMALGKWWLLHPQRRQFETIVFSPRVEVPDAYNLWKGFSCVARPGNCEKFLTHVLVNICKGRKDYYDYLIGWMARTVQHPDSPGQTSIVMRGRQGVGKSFFAKTFGSLWGRHFLQVSDPKHLVGSFNAHLRDCVVLFGDEAFYAGDKKHESILKTLVTEETIMIEGKGVDAEAAPNYTHILLASNNTWVIPAGADERRYFVLDIGDEQMQKSSYFKDIAEQMDNGGREALLHMLMTYDLSNFDVRAVPKTTALQEQKLLSMSPEEEWWYRKLYEGRLMDSHDSWQPQIIKEHMLDDYIEYMKRIGIQRRATSTSLGKFLQRICPGRWPRSYQGIADIDVQGPDGWVKKVPRRVYFYDFPPLEQCRAHWDESFGGPSEWPEEQLDLPELPRERRAVQGGEPF